MQLLPLLAWALLPGCGAVTGPRTVRGFLGGTLSVTCTYETGQENFPKYWCTPKSLIFPIIATCDTDLVITSESEPEVRQGRFFIRDNRTQRAFTVTVDHLSKKDAGSFYCGVRMGTFKFDERAAVEVTVLSASSTLPSSTSSTTSTTTFSDLTLSVTGSTQTVSQEEIVQSTSNPSTPQLVNVVEHILTPAIIVVLFLLAVAAVVLVILSRKKKATSKIHPALSDAAIEMDRTRSISPTGAETLNYADINHGTGAAESHYSNAEAFRSLDAPPTEYMEVRQSAQPLEEDREALYTKVQKPVPRQEQIYANVASAPQPSEELYSTVWGT